MEIGEICQREVDSIAGDRDVQAAAARMHQRSVGSLVVTDGDQKPIGIVTDRDLTVRVLAEGKDPRGTTVRQVMTKQPATVRVKDTIESAIALMKKHTCRRLIVVDSYGKLAGLVSLDDMLLHFRRQFDRIAALIRQESPSSLAKR